MLRASVCFNGELFRKQAAAQNAMLLSCLRFCLAHRRGRLLFLVMTPPRFRDAAGVVTELRQLPIEFLYCRFFLLQQVGDESLLAVLKRLFVRQKFLDVIRPVWFRHKFN
jgi:hypothetical protein